MTQTVFQEVVWLLFGATAVRLIAALRQPAIATSHGHARVTAGLR